MKQIKRSLFLTGILLLVSALVLPASANSAQTRWTGADAAGAIVTGEDCPIVVERERLTFDLTEFPRNHYAEISDYLNYSGSVTAEYTFYNPTDYRVTATLAFPFGAVPIYGHIRNRNTDGIVLYADTEKYAITADGAAIEKRLRHTFSNYGEQFELSRDLARLHDGFWEDGFYAPDLPVTRYTYAPSQVDLTAFPAAEAALVVTADPARTKIYLEGQNGCELLEDGIRLFASVDQKSPPVLCVIGAPLDGPPEWRFYENGACEQEIDGVMTLTGTETMTLEEFALLDYDPSSGVLPSDWYNAMVAAWTYFEGSFGAIQSTEIGHDLSDRLMRWYEYEITLEPGQRLVNTVTAPIYPSIDSRYEPAVYSYTYLLSPARTWAGFGTLELAVNTPYHLVQSGVEGLEPTDSGYAAHFEGLPEGELTFALSQAQAPKIPGALGPAALLAGGALLVVLIIVGAVLLRRKKCGKRV